MKCEFGRSHYKYYSLPWRTLIMSKWFVLFILICMTVLISACTGTHDPVQTLPVRLSDGDYSFEPAGPNRLVLGAWNILIDIENNTVEAVPLRTADFHFNVTPMITPPKCYDCFLAKNLSYDPVEMIVTVDIGFRNPSNITGYDVRGIITNFGTKELLNPDGYTDLFGPTPGELNPFIAFDTGVGNREFPALTDQFETIQIFNPVWPSFQPLQYIVEASWPDNCKEPYEVIYGGTTGSLYNNGSNTQTLTLFARDWQTNIQGVSVDLAPIGGGIINLNPSPSIPNAWQGPVSCGPGTPNNTYQVLAWAVTQSPFDQIDRIYNYVTLTVSDPPNPGAEFFGTPERISNSDANSFIWPRHAIAVKSDGTAHAVWVDYSANGITQHLFYSMRDGGAWTSPVQIDTGLSQPVYGTIACDSSDVLHVVWEDSGNHILGSDIYYANSTDSFATASLIAEGSDGLRLVHPKIEAGSDNALHVTWHSKELVDIDGEYEYDVWYDHRTGGSGTWDGAVSVVATEDINELWPVVSPAPDGSAYIAYQTDETGQTGIFFISNSSGSFAGPVPVAIGDTFQPAMDVAPDGTILVAYFDSSDDTFTDIYFRYSDTGGTTWSSAQSVSTSDSAFQYAPDVECSLDNDFHFVWHEEDETGRPGRVLYREYLFGVGFQEIIELVDSAGMGAFPGMDSDPDGHVHVVYQLFTPTTPPLEDNYEIWYRNSVP